MSVLRRRVQGLAFVTVVTTLVGLSIGEYAGAFDADVPVTLRVERVGNQLTERADVKIRGLIVGSVESVSTDSAAGGTDVALALDPAFVDQIPADVSARLIPKTLFGEKYVELVGTIGDGPSLAAGDVIPMDRSEPARELERVLDGLLPLLEAVPPQDLATTLGALSMALEGRGENLGETLVQLQTLTEGFNPALPDLQEDITALADFAGNLDDAAPDLLDALEDFTVTSRTVVEQRAQLAALLAGLTGTSDDTRAFLDANGENLIGLAASSRPTLESLARYSPQFPCLLEQLAGLVPLADQAFGKGTGRPGVHITLEIVNNRGKYVPNQDEPEYNDDRGPRCYPILPLGPQQPPDGPFDDGSQPTTPPVGTIEGDPDELGVVPSSYPGMGVANSPGEQQVVAELLAAQHGGSPQAVPAWSSMLVGPLYRGSEVRLT